MYKILIILFGISTLRFQVAKGECADAGIKLLADAGPLTCHRKKNLLDQHNAFRDNVASGNFLDYPIAADMNEVSWSTDIEALADEWAGKCKNEANPQPELNGEPLGEAFVEWAGELDAKKNLDIMALFQSSMSGEVSMGTEDDKVTIKEFLATAIGGVVNKMGCGLSSYIDENEDGRQKNLLVCYYSPKTDLKKDTLYTVGPRDCATAKLQDSAANKHLCSVEGAPTLQCEGEDPDAEPTPDADAGAEAGGDAGAEAGGEAGADAGGDAGADGGAQPDTDAGAAADADGGGDEFGSGLGEINEASTPLSAAEDEEETESGEATTSEEKLWYKKREPGGGGGVFRTPSKKRSSSSPLIAKQSITLSPLIFVAVKIVKVFM